MTEFTTWRSLVDGAEISAIPDTRVEDWEWGGPASDRYDLERGSFDNISIDQNEPVELGDFSCKFDIEPDEDIEMYREFDDNDDDQDYHPDVGDKIYCWFYLEESDSSPRFGCLMDVEAGIDRTLDGCAVEINGRDNEFVLWLDFTDFTTDFSPEANKFYLATLEFDEDNGDLTAEANLHDGPNIEDDIIETVTGTDTDSDLIGNRDVGFADTRVPNNIVFDDVRAEIGGAELS